MTGRATRARRVYRRAVRIGTVNWFSAAGELQIRSAVPDLTIHADVWRRGMRWVWQIPAADWPHPGPPAGSAWTRERAFDHASRAAHRLDVSGAAR